MPQRDELQELLERLLGASTGQTPAITRTNGRVRIPFNPKDFPFGADEPADYLARKLGFMAPVTIDAEHFVVTNDQYERMIDHWQQHRSVMVRDETVPAADLPDATEIADPWEALNRMAEIAVAETRNATPSTLTGQRDHQRTIAPNDPDLPDL